MKRTWAEIDIDALKFNLENIRKITNPAARIMAVVKADAYGHGYRECCKVLLDCGVRDFAVAMVSEAKELRRMGIDARVLVLGAIANDEVCDVVANDITAAVFDTASAELLSREAVRQKRKVKIHLKIDTGMSRLGFVSGDDNSAVIRDIIKISKMPGIEIDGIFSHFSCADEADTAYTDMQLERFLKLNDELVQVGIKIPCRHIANSAGIMMYPEAHLDMVRAGIILYGYHPSDEVDKEKLPLKPVMTLKSHVAYIKETEAGTGVSYGKTYITDKKTKIATIPVGYADGYLRCLSHKAKIEVDGALCNVIGRICMDQCMIDVTNVNNISIGDEVIIFGGGKISADSVAELMQTINYEVLCLVSKRIPRIYKEKGREVTALNYLDEI